ncbi:cellulose-complementing protein-like [Hypanus sabinus]|uniref:cellulose-complementing protein-like n=1 Tax=Hypanus sabinus TaxID=79690 RepID=UPI0028C41E9F|nr:cellulose-complementing protein-like [Hypanus sabinus]
MPRPPPRAFGLGAPEVRLAPPPPPLLPLFTRPPPFLCLGRASSLAVSLFHARVRGRAGSRALLLPPPLPRFLRLAPAAPSLSLSHTYTLSLPRLTHSLPPADRERRPVTSPPAQQWEPAIRRRVRGQGRGAHTHTRSRKEGRSCPVSAPPGSGEPSSSEVPWNDGAQQKPTLPPPRDSISLCQEQSPTTPLSYSVTKRTWPHEEVLELDWACDKKRPTP